MDIKNEEKVGIIIPSYNQGQFLEAAIQSIIANMKYANISLVIMDGGSTDNSLDIIKKYEKYIMHWCSKPDGGQAAAINAGVKKLSDCQYIMWLNSDDVYNEEDSVKKIVDFAVKNQYSVCYGKSYFINDRGTIIGSYPTEEYSRSKLKKICYISQPSVLVEKKAWDSAGGLNENLQMCLDYEMWIRLAMKYDFGYFEEAVGNTRIYNETKTATMQQRHLNEAISIIYKYYGQVPVHWIYSKVCEESKNELIAKLPKRIIKFFLLFVKKYYINMAVSQCKII